MLIYSYTHSCIHSSHMHRETWIQTDSMALRHHSHAYFHSYRYSQRNTNLYTHTQKHMYRHRRTLIHGTKTHVQNHTQIHTHSGLSSIWVSLGNLPYLHPELPEPPFSLLPGNRKGREEACQPPPPPLRSTFWGRTQEGRGLVGGLGLPHLKSQGAPL